MLDASVPTQVYFIMLQWGYILPATFMVLLGDTDDEDWPKCVLFPLIWGMLPMSVLIVILKNIGTEKVKNVNI